MPETTSYELIDMGGGGRLERFGERVVDRPAPAASGDRRDPAAWRGADLRFDRDRGWSGPAAGVGPWTVELARVTLELRPTDAGQVGLFPEHDATLPWVLAQGSSRTLNLFAYTGLATLACARAGAAVTHVDASRPTVAWARANAGRSGLADRPIRWIVDDARAFVAREARRGRTFEAILLDPPTYGHGPDGRPWSMAGLPGLLADCRAILEPGGAILVTAHAPDHDEGRLAAVLAAAMRVTEARIGAGRLAVTTSDGRALDLGAFARLAGAANRA